jgi:NSS family neurotransmitter:Na+ symporter
MILSMPCVLGLTVWSNVKIIGLSIMDFEDFLVNNILLPLGSLILVIFCVSKRAWGWKKFTSEANTGKGLKVQNWMRLYLTYVLPVIIAIVFVIGLYNFFK